ncbi:glycosyltransferase family 4 protein [Alienimonas sp. DA493]|uniref:glycosyltransferase family 4 protein n=1 Tax=Alienimonas sp. DA493 TaxID=3373605 RepID=UPI0037542FD5
MRLFVDGEVYGNQAAGGINRYFDELLPRIAAATGEPVRLLLRKYPKSEGPATGTARFHRFPLTEFPGFWRLPGRAQRWGRSWENRRWARRIDAAPGAVFHPTYYTPLPLSRTPTVVTVYDMIHEKFPHLYPWASDREFLKRKRAGCLAAMRFLAISEATKTDLCELYNVPPERVDVTPLAADNDFWRRHGTAEAAERLRERLGLREPYLLFVGGRWHYKNFRRLAEAFARWELRDEFLLATVGAPFDAEETTLLEELGLAGRVRGLGSLSTPEVAAAYAGASAYVYPSLYEGFGLPPLEAMACGTPVAAARAGSIPEVVDDAAELFAPEDVDAIRAALSRVVDPARAAELRAAGAQRIEEFSWDRTAELTLAAYRRVLAERS